MNKRPSNQEIRTALAGRAIVGTSADLLTEKFSAAFDKIDARGGIAVISNDIAARIEAARTRLTPFRGLPLPIIKWNRRSIKAARARVVPAQARA